MDIRDAAIERLIAKDPKQSAEQTLSLLMGHAGASAGGLFLVRARPELFVGRGIDQAGLDRVESAWSQDPEGLRAGHCQVAPSFGVFPVVGESPLLVYLAADRQLGSDIALDSITALGPLFATAVATHARGAASEPIIETFLESTSAEAIQRRQLQLALERNEWNLARVARLLGVTRVTIYKRMERLGIARIKVPKGVPRRAPA